MLSDKARLVAQRAKHIYAQRLRQTLEASDHGRFVCIEPESGEFFLGDIFDEAVNQAIDARPDRLTHTIRIGHLAAIHTGALAVQASWFSGRSLAACRATRDKKFCLTA